MAVDIYHTRRTHYKKCYFYKRNKNIKDLSKYVLEEKIAGSFWAKFYSPEVKGANQYHNIFMINNNKITVSTEDEIEGLEKNDIVKFRGKLWVVADDIQEIPHEKELAFSNKFHSTKVISLRR